MSTTHPTPPTTAADGRPIEEIADVVDTYLSAWNETDAVKRRELIDKSLGADLWYRDPMLEADGRDAFDAVLAAVQGQMPGHEISRTSGIDHHHDVVRFNWALGVPGEAPAFSGVDLCKYDTEGKLTHIVGFAGEAVAAQT